MQTSAMNYDQALAYTHSRLKFGIKPGLDRISAVMEKLGNPQDNLRCCHVAGTNGKGSVSVMLSEIFRAHGCKTGLYISPFVVDFRERIQINGQFISEENFAAIAQEVRSAAESVRETVGEITEFEFITAVAFVCFSRAKCDVVVLETGLGGRLDATNIIRHPLVSVITPISLDHTAVLGDTVEKIAHEKCGIIKPGAPVVSAFSQPVSAMEVIWKTCDAKKCSLIVTPEPKSVSCSREGTSFVSSYGCLRSPLFGSFQAENALTAISASRASGFEITVEDIQEGIANAVLPARFEIFSAAPPVVLDGSHNPAGADALFRSAGQFFQSIHPVAVMGVMADKDYRSFVQKLSPLFSEVITVTPAVPRALPAAELSEAVRPFCRTHAYGPVDEELIPHVMKTAGSRGVLFCGSFYLASEIRPYLLNYFQSY